MTPAQPASRRLVFGDDGSPGSDVAWLWINSHPWPGWRIEGWTGSSEPASAASLAAVGGAEEWTPPWGRDFFGDPAATQVAHFRDDADPRLVLEEQDDPDLLVVGVGEHDLGKMWSGSTAEWLMRHPPAPLVVASSAAKAQRVVWCADGSPHAQAAIDSFLSLPLAADAQVQVLVVDDRRVDSDAVGAAARAHLESAGVESDVVHVEGKPTRAILDHLVACDCNLVVLGTKGLTGWRRLRVGSTAGAVVQHARCAALLACADEPEDDDSPAS